MKTFLRLLVRPLLNQNGAVLFTYDNGNRLEDVMRQVVQVTPTETPYMSGIGKTQANNTLNIKMGSV